MKQQKQDDGRQVRTTSHFHAWWLVTLRGHRVRMMTQEPRPGFLRRLKYVTTYLLEDSR